MKINESAINEKAVDEVERVMTGLEDLINEIKTRAAATVTGVRIPNLTPSAAVTKNDQLIVEQADGTKVVTVEAMLTLLGEIQELVDARPDLGGNGHPNLKSRLDQMERVGLDNKTALDAYGLAIEQVVLEVQKARGADEQGVPYNTLGDRLDAMAKDLEKALGGTIDFEQDLNNLIAVVQNIIQNVEDNEDAITRLETTTQAMDGRITALENAGTGNNDIADLKQRMTVAEGKIATNEQDIRELKTTTLKYRLI